MQLPDFLTEEPRGSIRLTGHRIGVEHVVYYYNQGYSPEMILGQFPTLSLALIHKLIGFYLEHQTELDAYLADSEAEVSQQRAVAAASPDLAELRDRAAALSKSATQ